MSSGGMGGMGGFGQYGGQSYQPGGYGGRSFGGNTYNGMRDQNGGMLPSSMPGDMGPRAVGSPGSVFGKGPMQPEMSNPYSIQEPTPTLSIPPRMSDPNMARERPPQWNGAMTQQRFQPQPQTQQAPTFPAPNQRQAPPGYYFAPNGQMLNGTDPNSFNKGGAQTPTGAPTNIYGGGQGGQYGTPGYVPGSGWQQMLNLYSQQRNQNMGQTANFGRYPDGTPIADPNMNFRANDRQGRYGGGWDY